MGLKKPTTAGTLKSSDVQIVLYPNPGQGIDPTAKRRESKDLEKNGLKLVMI